MPKSFVSELREELFELPWVHRPEVNSQKCMSLTLAQDKVNRVACRSILGLSADLPDLGPAAMSSDLDQVL